MNARHVPQRWLSQGAERLQEELQSSPDGATPIDVLVIGSGYGAAVAAQRFGACIAPGGRPLRVVVLERGDEFVPGRFPDRFEQTLPQFRAQRSLKADHPIGEGVTGVDNALFDVHVGPEVVAIVGNGLGGGSLINAGIVERPRPSVLKKAAWPRAFREHHGDGTVLDKAFARVEMMLGAQAFTPAPPKSEALIDDLGALTARLGHAPPVRPLKVAVTQHPAPVPGQPPVMKANNQGVLQTGCNRCGNCVAGCNYWAKNTLPMNYLALAVREGVELYTGATAVAVRPLADGVATRWVVSVCRTHDRRGHEQRDLFDVPAHHVVIAAGTFGSPTLLHQSLSTREGAAALGHLAQERGGHLGIGISCNGDGLATLYDQDGRQRDVGSTGVDPRTAASHAATVGPTATGMIDLRDNGPFAFVVQDGAVPFPFARLFHEAATTQGAAYAMMDWNRRRPQDAPDDPLALSEQRLRRTQFLLLMGLDDAGWRFDLVRSATAVGDRVALTRASLAARQGDKSFNEERKRQKHVSRLVETLVQGRTRGRHLPNPLWAPAPEDLMKSMRSEQEPPEGTSGTPLAAEHGVTVHPLGGCRMADDARHGVVNARGQVFAGPEGDRVFDNLVVLDGSIVPTAVGINPLLTIAAIAERACDELALQWGYAASSPTLAPLPPQPPAVEPLPYDPQLKTGIAFREVLKGGLQLTFDPETRTGGGSQPPRAQRDVLAELQVDAHIDDLEALCRDPHHQVSQATGSLTLAWPVSSAASPANGFTPGLGQRKGLSLAPRLFELLPSQRTDRVWRAMRHWLHARGRAFLHDEFRDPTLRRRALRWILRALALENDTLRGLLLWLIDHADLPFLPAAVQKKIREVQGLLKVASHHGEVRVLRYDLGEVTPPQAVDGNHRYTDWPFKGSVQVLAAKRLHYGMSPGYHQRVAHTWPDPMLPSQVPSQWWRTMMQLEVIVLSQTQGVPLRKGDWPADQWPAGLPRSGWRVAARGQLNVDAEPLFTNQMPAYTAYRSLADAWLDVGTLAALTARTFVQSAFWRLRLPRYPDPLPDAAPPATAADERSLGPLPGMCLVKADGTRRYEDAPHLFKGIVWSREWIGLPDDPQVKICLTHFRPEKPPRNHTLNPVLLVHAFVTSGYMFATPRVSKNAVQALVETGRDVWVVELRTSVANPSSHQEWDFDIVAQNDIPTAVKHVFEAHQGQPVHVVAQCMGSAVFNMAALEGLLRTPNGSSMVASSTQGQVSMDLVSSAPNHLKASALHAMRSVLGTGELDTVADTRALGLGHRLAAGLDRLLWTWPVNDVDAMRMRDNRLKQPRQTCLPALRRTYALYGRIVSWDNLSQDVLDHWPELFRHAGMRSIDHLLTIERAGRLVKADGSDTYISDERIIKYFDFPVLFVQSRMAGVFDPATTRRSEIRLRRLHPGQPHERHVLGARKTGEPSPPRPWGHFDIWVGELAQKVLFPRIVGFLAKHDKPNQPPPTLPRQVSAFLRLPDPAPRLGAWRRSGANRMAGCARLAFSNPYGQRDRVDVAVLAIWPLPQWPYFHLEKVRDFATVPLDEGCGAIDVDLLPRHASAWVVLLCREIGAAFFDHTHYANLGGGQGPWWEILAERRPAEAEAPAALTARPPAGTATREPLPPARPNLAMSPFSPGLPGGVSPGSWMHIRVKGLDLGSLLGGALPLRVETLGRDAVTARDDVVPDAWRDVHPTGLRLGLRAFPQLDQQSSARLLLASCRYQSSGAERGMADRVFQRRLGDDLIDSLDFALLLGDQIYADATYGVFDGRPSIERLRDKYTDVWRGAPGFLASRLPTYLCVDDHEIRDDWFQGVRATPEQQRNDDDALGALDRWQMLGMPQAVLPPLPPNRPMVPHRWYTFQSAGFNVFVLDVRTGRQAPGTTLWDTDQREAFASWLTKVSGPDRPVLIAMSVPLFPWIAGVQGVFEPEVRTREDVWQGYPKSLTEFVDALFAPEVPPKQVVLLAGDPHISHHARGILQRGDVTIQVDSIVSSGVNAPLPFSSRVRGDIVDQWEGWLPETSTPTILSYQTIASCDSDGFAIVEIAQGAGGWSVTASFSGCDGGKGFESVQTVGAEVAVPEVRSPGARADRQPAPARNPSRRKRRRRS